MSYTYSWGREGLTKGSESLPLTTLVLRCFGSDVEATEREGDAGFGGFLLASNFLCRSISSRCWLMLSCCLSRWNRPHDKYWSRQTGFNLSSTRRGNEASTENSLMLVCFWKYKKKSRRKIRWMKTNATRLERSLDQVLECISVSPLLCVGCAMSNSGEVTQTETILHALLATWLLFLVALWRKTDKHRSSGKVAED